MSTNDEMLQRAFDALAQVCGTGIAESSSPAEALPVADPDAWMPDFVRWALERTTLREDHEDAQSVGSLLVDFAEWCIAHDAVPPRRETFEALLHDAGFPLKNGLAIGMILRIDLEGTK